MRGRVMSFWSASFLGMTTIGGPIVGTFAQYAGARSGLTLGGLAALFAAGIAWFKLRNIHATNTVAVTNSEENKLAQVR
jgi:MFS family permease